MCEYLIIKENKAAICTYTNQLCTFCVLRDSKTFDEAFRNGGKLTTNVVKYS